MKPVHLRDRLCLGLCLVSLLGYLLLSDAVQTCGGEIARLLRKY